MRRIGGVNAPVSSRDPVYSFLYTVELLRLLTSDDIMTSLLKKVGLSISIKIYVIKPLWSLFGQFPKLSTESVGSRL